MNSFSNPHANPNHDTWNRAAISRQSIKLAEVATFEISQNALREHEPFLTGTNYSDVNRQNRIFEMYSLLKQAGNYSEDRDAHGFRGMRVTTTELSEILSHGMKTKVGTCYMLTFAKHSLHSIGYAFASPFSVRPSDQPALVAIFQVRQPELRAIHAALPRDRQFFCDEEMCFDIVSTIPPEAIKNVFVYRPHSRDFISLFSGVTDSAEA